MPHPHSGTSEAPQQVTASPRHHHRRPPRCKDREEAPSPPSAGWSLSSSKEEKIKTKTNCSASSLQRPVALSNAASSPSPQLPRPRPTLQRSLSHASDRVRLLTLSCAGVMALGFKNASYPTSTTSHLTWLQERSRRLSSFSLRSETAANQPDFHSEEFERSVEGGF